MRPKVKKQSVLSAPEPRRSAIWQPACRVADSKWVMLRYFFGFDGAEELPTQVVTKPCLTEASCIRAFQKSPDYRRCRPKESVAGGSWRGHA